MAIIRKGEQNTLDVTEELQDLEGRQAQNVNYQTQLNDIKIRSSEVNFKKINDMINKSNTVLWNGPAGYFENENFMNGTAAIAEIISKYTVEKSLISILGGGDTLAAINKSKNKLSFTHLSTAGGAFLEFLEGKDLPGLSVLK